MGVSQNESVHPKLESQPSQDENPESKQTLKHIEVGIDLGNVDYACDVVLVSEFENMSDLKSYATHPEHLRLRNELGDLRIGRHQVDYLVES